MDPESFSEKGECWFYGDMFGDGIGFGYGNGHGQGYGDGYSYGYGDEACEGDGQGCSDAFYEYQEW